MSTPGPTKRGWLVNRERRERRDQPKTLTDIQVLQLIKQIEEIKQYTKLDAKHDRLMRLRDQALIALAWIFFKRGGEDLDVTLRDIYFDKQELHVTFQIEKRSRRIKVCPECSDSNALKAVFCKQCGGNIENIEHTMKGEPGTVIVTKRKTMKSPFCIFVVKWVQELRKLGCSSDDYLFPQYSIFTRDFVFDKQITVTRFNQILQRLDVTLTSCMFRYGHSEKLFVQGYTPYEVKEIGDWASDHMPEVYAKRKGFTKSQKRFAKDTRQYE